MELTEAVRIVREIVRPLVWARGRWSEHGWVRDTEKAAALDAVLAALEQAQAQANVALLDAVRVRGELREMEAERDAAQRDLAHQEDLTDRQRARTAELERGLAEAEAERDALRAAMGETPQEQWQEMAARVARAEDRTMSAEAEAEALREKLSSVTEDYIKERNAATAAETERDALRAELDRPKHETLRQLADAVERNAALKAERDALRAAHHDAAAQWQQEARLRREAQAEAFDATHAFAMSVREAEALHADVERRKALAAATQLECNRLAADLSRTLAEVERPFRERIEQAEEALRTLLDKMERVEAALRAEVERLRTEKTEIIGIVQRWQPVGSPPPVSAQMLVRWICQTLENRAEKAEAALREILHAEQWADVVSIIDAALRAETTLDHQERAIKLRLVDETGHQQQALAEIERRLIGTQYHDLVRDALRDTAPAEEGKP